MEIEHEEEVESVKENLVLLSDDEYPADFEDDQARSPEYKRFAEQSAFLKEVNESLVEAPHFLFDKFMTAIKLQQENYNGLVTKIDRLEDKLRNDGSQNLVLQYQELENRICHLEADVSLLKAQRPTSASSYQMQDAIKKLENICTSTVNGVNDVMHYIKSQQSSELNLNQNYDRPFTGQSNRSFNPDREQQPSHKSDMFSDFHSDSGSSRVHHNIGNDWNIKTPTKPSSRAASHISSVASENRNHLQVQLQKQIIERRQWEDRLLQSNSNVHARQSSTQIGLLDKTISDLRQQIEKL